MRSKQTTSTHTMWSVAFAIGLGIVGCGNDLSQPEGEGLFDPTEASASANSMTTVTDEPVEMEPTVEELPDPPVMDELPPVMAPAQRCTSNVTAQSPYARDLPGWDRFEFDVQIAPDTISFQIVGHNARNNGAMFEGFTRPDGTNADFWTDPEYDKLISTWYYTTEGSVSALTMPTDPRYRLQTGTYTFRGLSQDTEFCYYVVEDTAPGTTLDLNVFFVGTQSVTVDDVAVNEDWLEVEQIISNTFAAAGLAVRFNYVALSEELRRQHEDPRSIANLDDAVRDCVAAVDPLPMRSVDVFLWDRWGGEAEGIHGMARGIPEAAGLHGERGTGVVLQLMDLLGFEGITEHAGEMVGNVEIGLSISHEIGHLLGLFHTSEFYAATHDAVADTPECADAAVQLDSCPDASNLMFPLGPMYASSELSELQIAVMAAHPSLGR